MRMELATAIKWAGLKLAGGLVLLAALLAIRNVTATPTGLDPERAGQGVAISERVAAGVAAEEPSEPDVDDSSEAATEGAQSGSFLSRVSHLGERVGEQVRERLPVLDPPAADAERLVSCAVGGSVHFMRAADCAMRGGRAGELE